MNMSIQTLLSRLKEKGIHLEASGTKLRVRAPIGVVTAEIRNSLSSNKTRILRALSVNRLVPHRVVVDGKGITLLAPSDKSLEEIKADVYKRFGRDRVTMVNV